MWGGAATGGDANETAKKLKTDAMLEEWTAWDPLLKKANGTAEEDGVASPAWNATDLAEAATAMGKEVADKSAAAYLARVAAANPSIAARAKAIAAELSGASASESSPPPPVPAPPPAPPGSPSPPPEYTLEPPSPPEEHEEHTSDEAVSPATDDEALTAGDNESGAPAPADREAGVKEEEDGSSAEHESEDDHLHGLDDDAGGVRVD